MALVKDATVFKNNERISDYPDIKNQTVLQQVKVELNHIDGVTTTQNEPDCVDWDDSNTH
jgi:hypothetical protein